MLESFAMDPPINNDEIEMFLRSLSYAEICQEITATSGSVATVNHANRINENHPAFCHTRETPTDAFNVRQNQPNTGEVNKG